MFIDINEKMDVFTPRISVTGAWNGVGDIQVYSGAAAGSRIDYISVSKPEVAKRPYDPPANLFNAFKTAAA